ncbi:hypothetical protein [Glutamicibacter sp. X7]
MKHWKIAAAVVAAGLALTGCTPVEVEPAPETAPAVPSDAPKASKPVAEPASKAKTSVDDSQERADKIMDQFLASYDRTSFDQFSDGTPHQLIKDWYLKSDGKTFVIVVSNDANRFSWLAEDFLERTFYENDLYSATVLNEDSWGATRTISDIK